MSVRILYENYLDPDIISNSFVSSEQSAFPVSNAYNKQRRSKVYRSNGYWEITADNNVLIFEETSGTPLTATVAEDEYVSFTTFAAALKTALEATGASTYTITQDTNTKKIKIQSDGSGGAGILNLKTTNVLSTLAPVIGFDTAIDRTGSLTYTADALRISTSEWLKWDFGISTNPKAFVLIGPRNKPIKITPSAILTLQGNETDTWDSPTYEQTLTYNDQAIILMNKTGIHTEALRYWRLLIEDNANSLGFVEIGAVYLGNILETTRGAAQFPFRSKYVDRSNTVFSEGGQTFSDIREKTQEFDLEWFGLTVSECEQFDALFNEVGTSIPFFIVYDPTPAFSSSVNFATRFVKFSSEPSFDLVSPGNFSASWQLREEL